MMRPLSFTKNLGGYQNLHRMIRHAYRPGISLTDFQRAVPTELRARVLIASEFFIATRVFARKEIVFEDELIRQTLASDMHMGLCRLYLFALLLNLPGQRLRREYRSPSEAQNMFVREVLHDGNGWVAKNLEKNAVIEPWVRSHVTLTGKGAARKFTTNLAYFFEQCRFRPNNRGYLVTAANTWGPVALRLFFERYRLLVPASDVEHLSRAARDAEIHKLLGVEMQWFSDVVAGAAQSFVENVAAEPRMDRPEVENAPLGIGPAGRMTKQVEVLKRSAKNLSLLETWYSGKCQICGERLPSTRERAGVDYAHIKPLGSPHDGPDHTGNMLSLCPNHHRQFERHAIAIRPDSLEILAPLGSAPPTLLKLLQHSEHRLSADCLHYWFQRFSQQHGPQGRTSRNRL